MYARRSLSKVLFSGLVIMVATCIGVLSAFSLANAASDPKPIVWKATSVYGTGLIVFEGADLLAKRVKEMSNGRLIIQMNAGGSVVPAFSEQEAVSKGILDLSCSSSIYIRGKFPEGVLFGASIFGFSPQEFLAWLETGGGYEMWQEMYDLKKWNVKVLPCNGLYGGMSLGWFKKPVKTLADFKGLKYRSVGEFGEVLTKLGASVTTLPSGEVYTSLERGVLDATSMSFPAVDRGLGLHEICKYMLFPGVHQTSGPLETLVNKDKWNALPADLQAIVKAALREVAVLSLTRWAQANIEAMAFFKEHGVKTLKLEPQEIAKLKVLFEQVLQEHAKKNNFYKKILDSQNKFHKSWRDFEMLERYE